MSCFYPRSSATSSQGLSAPNRNTKRPWGWVWVIMDLEAPSTCIRIFLKMEPFFSVLGRPPFSRFSVECVSWLIGSVGQIEKKITESHGRRPGTPVLLRWSLEKTRHETKSIWRKNKVGWCYCKIKTTWEKGSTTETPMRHTSIPRFSTTTTIFIFLQIKRIISSEEWFNFVVPFFLKVPKIGVGRMTLKVEIKEDGPRRS